MDVLWHLTELPRSDDNYHLGLQCGKDEDGLYQFYSSRGYCRELFSVHLRSTYIENLKDSDGHFDIISITSLSRKEYIREWEKWFTNFFGIYTKMLEFVTMDAEVTQSTITRFLIAVGRFSLLWSRSTPEYLGPPNITHQKRKVAQNIDTRNLAFGGVYKIPISWAGSIAITSSLPYFVRIWKDITDLGVTPSVLHLLTKHKIPTPSVYDTIPYLRRFIESVGLVFTYSRNGGYGLWTIIALCLWTLTDNDFNRRRKVAKRILSAKYSSNGMNTWSTNLLSRGRLPTPVHDVIAEIHRHNNSISYLFRPNRRAIY